MGRHWASVASKAAIMALAGVGAAQAEMDPACRPGVEVIASQPLDQALLCLSRITGAAVFADASALEGFIAPQVRLSASPAQIASQLAADAPVQILATDDGSILIRLREDRAESARLDLGVTSGARPFVFDDVIIVRGFASSYSSALVRKRDDVGFTEAINTEEVGQFPDQNLAEAVQRLPGVSITRQNGEGETVSIRGLSPEFTRVEIDGRTTIVNAETADPERASLLSVFNPDHYARMEVIKTPSAADIEGGLGGIVRLYTPNPLDLPQTLGRLELRIGEARLRDRPEFGLSGFLSRRAPDSASGFYIAGTLESLDRRIDTVQATRGWTQLGEDRLSADADIALLDSFHPARLRLQQRTGDRWRGNASFKGIRRFAAGPQLEVSGLYVRDEREEDRARLQLRFDNAVLQSGIRDAQERLSLARFDAVNADFHQSHRDTVIESSGLGADLRFQGPASSAARVYAGVQHSEERWRQYTLRFSPEIPARAGYELHGDAAPVSVFADITGFEAPDLGVDSLQFRRRILTLSEAHAGLDLDGGLNTSLLSGWRAGTRVARAQYQRRQGALSAASDPLTLADAPRPFVAAPEFAPGTAYRGDVGWASADPASFYAANKSGAGFVFDDENAWTVEEQSWALYGLLEFETPFLAAWRLSGDGGLRLVGTQYEGRGRLNVQVSDTQTELRIDDRPPDLHSYFEALPTFRLRAGRGDEWALRAGVGRSLSRPSLFQSQPGVEVDTGDLEIVRGRTDLAPYTAWTYDAGVERYLGASGLVSGALFHKSIESFVVASRTQAIVAFPEAGLEPALYQIDSWRNAGSARISGLELAAQTSLAILIESLSDFGVYANATFTDSRFSDGQGRQYTFPGASGHSWNVAAWYEAGGFSARLAWTARSHFLIEPAGLDGQNASFGAGSSRLDLALRYRFGSGLQMSLDALNLTGSDEAQYWDDAGRLQAVFLEDRILTAGLGWRF